MRNQNKLLLIGSILFTPALMASPNYCGSKSEEKCSAVVCPDKFNDIIGVWRGKEKLEYNNDTLTTDVQLIFTKKSCLANSDKKIEMIIGRQTTVIPAGKNNASKTDYKEVLISENKSILDNLGAAGESIKYKKDDLKIAENDLHTKMNIANRNVEFQKLEYGQLSYFAGKTWTLTQDGKLVGTSDFLLKSSFDPSSNSLKEVVHYKNNKNKGAASEIVVDVYEVNSEVYEGARAERKLNKSSDGNDSDTFETVADGKIYREERVRLKNNAQSLLHFKSGDQISSSEFARRLDTELQNQTKDLRRPSSVNP